MTHVSEDYYGAPDPTDPNYAWGECKRAAELLCALYSKKYGIETKIARCFSFVGPYLQLDIHYAIGNFIRDALQGGPIRVKSNGTAHRSYLYAADLAIWLWTILVQGESCRAYNVGSEEDVTIARLASMVAEAAATKPIEVRIAKTPDPGSLPERYVPSTRRAQVNLGVRQHVDLRTAIERTLRWSRSGRSS
jgi:dTDP-glucose 4,6-dehydratase